MPLRRLLAAAASAALSAAAVAAPAAAPRRTAPDPGATAPQAAPARPRSQPGTATVTYVTAGRAYLDAGSEDGLAAGQELELRRGDTPAARCRVEAAAPHHATCAGAGIRAGDVARFEPPKAPPAPRVLAEPAGEEELARRRAALSVTPVPLVEYSPTAETSAVVQRTKAFDVSATHSTWATSTAKPYQRESLDLLLRGVPVASRLFLDVDARLEHWTTRPSPQALPRIDTRVYLWQAQLTAFPTETLTLAAGRILPWTVPGSTIFDGAMAGMQRGIGSLRIEGGLFGGAVPEPDTLEATSRRATAGAFWSVDRAAGAGVALRHEGRIAFVRTPELGDRAEASLTGRAFLRRLDLSAEAHLGVGGKQSANGGLDAGRIDAVVRPGAGLSLGGSFRHTGLAWPQPFEPPAFPGRSNQADGFLNLDVGHAARLGAVAGYSEDLDSHNSRRWLGPELALPRLLLSRGGLWLGYLEERGWLAGRSAYAQLAVRPWTALRLLARASWSHEATGSETWDEVALGASAVADLTQHFGLRLSVNGRMALDANEPEGSTRPAGLTAFATLFASY